MHFKVHLYGEDGSIIARAISKADDESVMRFDPPLVAGQRVLRGWKLTPLWSDDSPTCEGGEGNG